MGLQKKKKYDDLRANSLTVVNSLTVAGSDLTASIAELATLDGLTADVNELNTLEGYTGDVTDFNKLAGVTATAAELNLNDDQVAGATIVVGADAGTTVTVTIQLTDAAGADMARAGVVYFYVSSDSAGQVLATATDGGMAIGSDGLMIEWTADLAGMLISEADGDIDIVFTDSDAGTWYLVLVIPNTGERVISDAITFSA